jgi:hypothetical protein
LFLRAHDAQVDSVNERLQLGQLMPPTIVHLQSSVCNSCTHRPARLLI